MHITDPTGNFRFEITLHGKEEFGVTNAGVNAKGYVFAESAADIIVEFGAFYIAQERQHRKQPTLFLELHIDGILRNIVRPKAGRGLANKQFAESKIDRGLVLAADGTHIMKKFRFVDLDLDDAILESRIVGEAGAIELKVLEASVQPDIHDKEPYLLPSMHNDRGAVSLLNGELNNTLGIRFDDGEKSIADNKYTSLRQSTDCMLARRTWPLGKLIAQASFIYGSIDLINSFGVIPQDHKYFKGSIATVKQAIRHQRYIETDPKLIQKALFESDYTLGAKIREQFRFESPPQSVNHCIVVVLPTENQNQQSALEKDQVTKQMPKEIRLSSGSILKANSPPNAPQRTPAQVAKQSPLNLKISVETSKVNSSDGIGLLTPKATSPIYPSLDGDDDVIFLYERKVMRH